MSAAATEVDVAIVGGGMVGASLALALRDTDLRVALIEGFAPDAAAQPSFDERTTAIGNGSRAVFEALGAWPRMAGDGGVIRAIHVSDAGRYGFARLVAADLGLEAFGCVLPNRVIGRALWEGLAQAPRLTTFMPARPVDARAGADRASLEVERADGSRATLHAALLVAADGAQSTLRAAFGLPSHVEDYGQVAVVANVAADRAHDGTAYERFTSVGPLALLPLADGSYTVVWARTPADAAEAREMPDAQFLAQLQQRFGWRAGRFVRVGRRVTYPLALTRSDATHATRLVLIGNAAQALHPVAGQGFNLGLRDAATLAEVLVDARAGGADIGGEAVLARFAAARAADRRGVTGFTDGLVKLFRDDRPGVGALRDLGLLLFDLAPPAKRVLSRVSWGFTGRLPRLARGLDVHGRSPTEPR
ncbi:MAG TPA: 2-octaprenyl-6-methoxyphenyl hydroxylase [Steroidobacteraceae bacterium]|nr:2-octaprenyl-6-methoxyphenyl hydroxylase [Steroidobacteraceae bacterium]HNS28504.1 2-octaprenyl-6-methoxyphenyl hydroxylase [Steroidobacteraceae bacterium]